MKKNLIIVLTGIILFSKCCFSQEKITVEANQQIDPSTQFMQGFLHGGSIYLDSVKVAKLKPAYWRIGAYFLAGSGYQETKRFNPKITVNINDLYMIENNIPSQSLSQPWVDGWVNWDNLVSTIAINSINNNEPVDIWDVWGEPDNFWTGTYSQWIEMFRRTENIITSIIPNSKIIGPEFGFATCNFDVTPIIQFLDNLYSVGTTISGVSWHEFCNPQDVPLHVQQVRDSLEVRPWLGNLDILIPEYANPTNHTIPGWNVGWLYYLEKSKVNWVSHSCWNETDGTNTWSNCEFGLNGLFMSDNITTQPNYWVHRAYAELDERIFLTSTHPKTVALASKNNISNEMKILIGRFDNPNLGSHNSPSNVEVKINNYPYCNNCTVPYIIQKIPSNDVAVSIPLNEPTTTETSNLTFTDNSSVITINNFIDGDAYIIYINPTSVLSTNLNQKNNSSITLYPNPSNDFLTINLNANNSSSIQIVNILGNVIKEITLQSTKQIDISNLPSGFYFVRNSENYKQIQKFIKK